MKKTTMFKIAGVATGVALPVAMVFANSSNFTNPNIVTTPGINGNFQTGTLFNGVQSTGLTYSGSFVERAFGFLAQVLRAIPPLLVAIAGVVFMFNVIKFILEGDAAKKDTEKKAILYSLLALVVLLGFWGIVGMISRLIGVRTGESVTGGDIPRVYITPN